MIVANEQCLDLAHTSLTPVTVEVLTLSLDPAGGI